MGLWDLVQDMLYDAVEDTAAVEEAIETMYDMVGNEGQEAILNDGMDTFEAWAEEVLSFNGSAGPMAPRLMEVLGDEKWNATNEIWEEGGGIIADAADSVMDSLSEADEDMQDEGAGGNEWFGERYY